MRYIVVDIEADGPVPGKYSMVSIGAVAVDSKTLGTVGTFYRDICPISKEYDPAALQAVGVTREHTLKGRPAKPVMREFGDWLQTMSNNQRIWMVADNAGFDWMFVCWYFHEFTGKCPLGHSCFSLTSFVKGFDRNMFSTVHSRRVTPHNHNALDDAQGNAEVLVSLLKELKN